MIVPVAKTGMEKTPAGTAVGVDDPYDHVDRCDHLTDDGRCRFAVKQGDRDPAFADARSREHFQCPVAGDRDETGRSGPWEWQDCPHFRCRDHDRACARCGLEERRIAHSDERPLLEEHHLSYADAKANPETATGSNAGTCSGERDGDDGAPAHEITVYLCRWCHAKVHDSWARIDDDATPDTEAIAEREGRRSREQSELGFESAAERYDRDGGS